MLRSFFLYLSKSSRVRGIITRWSIAWRMAGRFVAGEKLEDAVRVIQSLNSKGINATLDHLGEHTDSTEASINASREIIEALNYVEQSRIRANISIKLTQLGLIVDKKLCVDNLRNILGHAKELNNFIRIDMEDSSTTQTTLDLLMQMRREGYTNVGIVIQSYLYRSKDDLSHLIDSSVPIRLCKGAYNEPSEIAYPVKRDVDNSYDELSSILLKASEIMNVYDHHDDGKFPPLAALATHDERRINYACEYAENIKLDKSRLEFQMLFGVRRDLQTKLADSGYPVRVYVPYGTEWYPYFMRRLAERPANVWFLLSNIFRY